MPRTFADRLEEALRDNDWTAWELSKELSKRSDLAPSYQAILTYRKARGSRAKGAGAATAARRSEPRMAFVPIIAEALGVEPAWLAFGVGEKTSSAAHIARASNTATAIGSVPVFEGPGFVEALRLLAPKGAPGKGSGDARRDPRPERQRMVNLVPELEPHSYAAVMAFRETWERYARARGETDPPAINSLAPTLWHSIVAPLAGLELSEPTSEEGWTDYTVAMCGALNAAIRHGRVTPRRPARRR